MIIISSYQFDRAYRRPMDVITISTVLWETEKVTGPRQDRTPPLSPKRVLVGGILTSIFDCS